MDNMDFINFKELDDIENIMIDLIKHYDSSTEILNKNEPTEYILHNLFWTRGSSNDHIRGGIEKSSTCDRCWILGDFELKIKSIVIFNKRSMKRNYLIIETDILERTGIYNDEYYEKNYMEEFGVYESRAIKLNEYDCGWANIDGKRVNVFGKAEKKAKILKSTLFFIAPQGSFINDRFKEEEINTIIELYENENCFNEEILSLLQKL